MARKKYEHQVLATSEAGSAIEASDRTNWLINSMQKDGWEVVQMFMVPREYSNGINGHGSTWTFSFVVHFKRLIVETAPATA